MWRDLERTMKRIEGFVAARLDDGDDRAELTQLCLIKVWRRGHTFRGESAFNSWLYRIVHNEVVDWSRREARHDRIVDALWDVSRQATDDPEKRAIDRVGVQRTLAGLSGVDRQVVELTYLRDLTSVHVGEALGLAPSSVRCRLHRLRRTLKRDLPSDLVDSELRATA